MTPETEERIAHQLTALEELVKHLYETPPEMLETVKKLVPSLQ